MNNTVQALQVTNSPKGAGVMAQVACLPWQEVAQGEVTIQVHYSSINYKDALGITGQGKIFKKLPIIPGIDAAGIVVESTDPRHPPGSAVIVTGCGLGENRDGGYCEYISVPADWVVAKPAGLSLYEAMALGSAGFTAGLCVARLEDNGQSPSKGPFVVTGASGGVGSIAVQMMSALGYHVVAVSGKAASHSYLRELGAAEVMDPQALQHKTRPLESVRWGGAIDNVGGDVLAGLIPALALWGNVACVGLALNAQLHTTVMPFILRGVSLLGISSTNCPQALRSKIWQRLGTDLKPAKLEAVVAGEVGLSGIVAACEQLIARKVTGRYIVNCQR